MLGGMLDLIWHCMPSAKMPELSALLKIVFEIEFIELDTWQAHLEDIACYLLPESVWWQTRDDKIEYFAFAVIRCEYILVLCFSLKSEEDIWKNVFRFTI